MSDLVSGLIKDSYQSRAFWGKYENLNYVNELDNSALFRLQLVRMKTAEQKHKNFNIINNFIKTAQNQTSIVKEQVALAATKSVEGQVIQLLNSAFKTSPINPAKNSAGEWNTKAEKNKQIDAILANLTGLLDQIHPGEPIDIEMVEKLQQTLQKSKINNQDFHDYIRIKADYAEKLAVDVINKNENFKAIQSGNFVDELGQQLIEDIMVFNAFTINTDFGTLSFKVTKKKGGGSVTLHAKSIQEFLNKVEKIGGNYTIQLPNPLYEALQKAAAMNVQVKSGIVQDILTKAERNAITLGEAGFGNYPLWNLYNLDNVAEIYFKSGGISSTLESITNYYLSRAIALTALSRNQVYFTKDGFVSASEWMELNQRMLKFFPAINSMSKDMLMRQCTYRFTSV